VHVGRARVNLSRIAMGWAHFLCGVGHQMKDLCSRSTGYSCAIEVEEHLRSHANDVRWYRTLNEDADSQGYDGGGYIRRDRFRRQWC
jgi:hypothetical protein